jgi:hypothetical protein
LLASERGLVVNDQSSLLSSSDLQKLSNHDGSYLRMYRDSSLPTKGWTLGDSSVKWSLVGTAWDGGVWMPDTSEYRSGAGESSLSPVEPKLVSILEPQVDSRYALSAKAAAGILRRASRRGRTLPEPLDKALRTVVSSMPPELLETGLKNPEQES